METNANTPLINPKLSELFKKRSEIAQDDKETMNACMSQIAEEAVTNARFLSVIQVDEKDITTDENGNVTFNKDAQIHFVLLNGPENKPYFPVFTDWDNLRKWEEYKDADVNTMVLSFDDYYTMVADNENGVVINPFSDNIIFTNKNMHHFKEVKDLNTKGHTEHVLTEETKVLLADPAPYPTELTEAVASYAKKQKNINAIWLKLMINGEEKSFLLAVDFEGDRKTTFNGIAEAARPFLPKDMFIDIINSADNAAETMIKDEPFYKRKKGFFGLFG